MDPSESDMLSTTHICEVGFHATVVAGFTVSHVYLFATVEVLLKRGFRVCKGEGVVGKLGEYDQHRGAACVREIARRDT